MAVKRNPISKINWEVYFGEWANHGDFEDKILNTRHMNSALKFLSQEYKRGMVLPFERIDIFKAFRLCSPDNLKAIIIGDFPTGTSNDTGIAFGQKDEAIIQPITDQIRTAVEADTKKKVYLDFDVTLENWAKQGVLLINTSLTCRIGEPESHKTVWIKFIKRFLSFVIKKHYGVSICLWGSEAQKYKRVYGENLDITAHVFTAKHPREHVNTFKYWECNHFSRINDKIKGANGREFCIEW